MIGIGIHKWLFSSTILPATWSYGDSLTTYKEWLPLFLIILQQKNSLSFYFSFFQEAQHFPSSRTEKVYGYRINIKPQSSWQYETLCLESSLHTFLFLFFLSSYALATRYQRTRSYVPWLLHTFFAAVCSLPPHILITKIYWKPWPNLRWKKTITHLSSMIGNPPLVFNQIRTLLEARLFKTMEICAICLRTGRHSRVASFLFLM